jgi:hydroxymethylbilane synthase
MKKIRIGTRASRLALAQTGQVREALHEAFPRLRLELVPIKTTGDKIPDAPLSRIGGKGLFTKEIERELIAGRVDMAVHSMKDMPTELPAGLTIGAVTERLDPLDVFISRKGKSLAGLKQGGSVATGSMRRKAQLLAYNPGLDVIDIRGNVETRLRKMRANPHIDGVILARAGLERLGISDDGAETVPEGIIMPAVGQAALAIEIREGDPFIQEIVSLLDHEESNIAVSCERAFLSELGGGCQVPIAALARVAQGALSLEGLVASLDGVTVFRGVVSGSPDGFDALGRRLARKLLDDGADKVLKAVYGAS